MKAEIVKTHELSPAHISQWRAFQAGNPAIWSPFFSPEFTLAIGAARSDARVAILLENNEVCSFLPFHLCPTGIGKPIGGPISDYQGVISAAHTTFDGSAILLACGLKAYDFNHAPTAQSALKPGALHLTVSPHIDLSAGFDAYVAEQSKVSKEHFKKYQRRLRKLEREIGPVRFELHDDSPAAWGTVVAMKNASYDRLGVDSILDVAWVDRALATIRAHRSPDFAGLVSTLYAGDRPVAAHMGMRSSTTIHWWFNTYDYELRAYAPGLALLLMLAKRAADDGLKIIDFGRGTEDYKLTFSNGSTELCEGSIERPNSLPGTVRRFQKLGVRAFARVPLGRYESLPRRALHRFVTSMSLPDEAA